jgi:hypothetical protein
MKKLYFLFFLPLWGAGGFALAQSTVTVTPMGADYGEKTVTFRVKWSGAAHNNRVWIWVDYCPVEGVTPASTFSPASIGAVTITASDGSVTTSSGSTRGFFVAYNPATVTAILLDATGKFNWCAHGSGDPPNAILKSDGSGNYRLRGTKPFTVNDVLLAAADPRAENWAPDQIIFKITDFTGYKGFACMPGIIGETIHCDPVNAGIIGN